jgi:uracil-DNA glycosylase
MDIDQQPNDIDSDVNPAQALSWLVEMGADEIVVESAIDRFAASAVVEKAKEFAPLVHRQASPQAPLMLAPTLPGQAAAEAATQAAACTSLENLKQALNYFEANPLRKSATQLSFMEGNFASPVLVMGDRPRNEEDKSGQVFAGKSRELLQRMLAAIELEIEDVTLMNFIPWRPPGNRAPSENEIAMCMPFANRAIELLQPKLILSFGGLAGQWLAGGEASIARQRGKWQNLNNVPMLATIHPDELLKFPAQKKLAWRDLLAFRIKLDEVLN